MSYFNEDELKAIRRFCEPMVLKGQAGHRIYRPGDQLPDDYGSYGFYDGTVCWGGGVCRRLSSAAAEFERRSTLSNWSIPILVWKPDTDGSVRAWIEDRIDDEDEERQTCALCDGTGLDDIENRECGRCCGEGTLPV